MQYIIEIIKAPSFWAIVIPAIIAVYTYSNTEKNRIKWEQYKRKEERYIALIRSSRGFYVSINDPELKNEFIQQINLCWLYAPDAIINKAYEFLMTVHKGVTKSDAERELAFGEFMAAIREDMIGQRIVKSTALAGKHYRHLKVNR